MNVTLSLVYVVYEAIKPAGTNGAGRSGRVAGLEGKTLGNCHILRRIGGGGMGEVYLAEQPDLGRQVAVKVILGAGSLGATERAQASQQFLQEARAVAALDHPHILPLFAYGQEDDIHYLVMPYIPDGSLANLVQEPAGPTGAHISLPMAPPMVVEIITQAAAALQFAHDRGVIHRDVKPQNMLIRLLSQAHSAVSQTMPSQPPVAAPVAPAPGTPSSSFHVQLADFGLARYLADLAGTTGATGTPLYSSPEQCRGYPVPATDQYALACVAYYLLSGKPLFEGTVAELHYQHLAVMPRSILQVNPMLPPATDTVLQRALAKDPEQRYPRVYDFAHALQNALASASLASQPMQQPRPWPAPSLPLNPQQGYAPPSVPLYAPNAAPPAPAGAPMYSPALPQQPGYPAPQPFPGAPIAPMPQAMPPQQGMLGPTYPAGQPGVPQNVPPAPGAPVPPYAPVPGVAAPPSVPLAPASPAGLTVETLPAYASGISPASPVISAVPVSPASPYSSAPPPAVVPTGGWRAQADGPAAPLPPRSRRGGRQISRRTFAIGAAAVVGVAAVGTGIVILGKGGSSTAPKAKATVAPPSATAKLKWRYPTGAKVLATAAIANDTVYFGSLDTYVYALNAVTGALVWRTKTGGPITAGPVIATDTVYIGSSDGYLYAFDAATGTVRWRFNGQSPIGTTPAVASGTVYLGWNREMIALSAANGAVRWRYTDKQGNITSPAVGNGRVYYGGNGRVIALSAGAGQQLWQYPHGNGAVFSNALVDGDTLYVGDHAGYVNALGALDGTLRWQGKTGARVLDQPTAAGGAVYAGSEDGSIYAFDAATGKKLWSYATAKPSYSSPAVANGIVYGASTDSYVYALDAATGTLHWRVSCGSGITASPVLSRSALYIGSSDANLYALTV